MASDTVTRNLSDLPLSDNLSFKLPKLPDSTRSIRLLQISPSNEVHNLQCRMVAFANIAEAPSYIAISYRWSDKTCPIPIHINNGEVRVNVHCYSALWHQRLYGVTSWVWVDTLCINQDDVQEKSAQVALMGTIYSSASEVRACLNDNELNSTGFRALWTALESLGTSRECSNHREIHCLEDVTSDHTPSKARALLQHIWSRDDLPCVKCTLIQLLSGMYSHSYHPYWSRLWIIQEIELAERVLVCVGGQVYNLELLKWKYIRRWIATVESALETYSDRAAIEKLSFEKIMDEDDPRSVLSKMPEPFCMAASSCDHRITEALFSVSEPLLYVLYSICESARPQRTPSPPTGSREAASTRVPEYREDQYPMQIYSSRSRSDWLKLFEMQKGRNCDGLVPEIRMLKILEPDFRDATETFLFESTQHSWIDFEHKNDEIKPSRETLLHNIMGRHSEAECKDSRDSIFGLISLAAHRTALIKPNYTRDLPEVVVDAISCCSIESMHQTPRTKSWSYHQELHQCVANFRKVFWYTFNSSNLEISKEPPSINEFRKSQNHPKVFLPIPHYQCGYIRLKAGNGLSADLSQHQSSLICQFAETCRPIYQRPEELQSRLIQIGEHAAYLANCEVLEGDIIAFVFYQEVPNADSIMQPPGFVGLIVRQLSDQKWEVVGKAVGRTRATVAKQGILEPKGVFKLQSGLIKSVNNPWSGSFSQHELSEADLANNPPKNPGIALSIDVLDYLRLIWMEYTVDPGGFFPPTPDGTFVNIEYEKAIDSLTMERLKWPAVSNPGATKAWLWEDVAPSTQADLKNNLLDAGWSQESAIQAANLMSDGWRHESRLVEHQNNHFAYARFHLEDYLSQVMSRSRDYDADDDD